MSTDIIPYAAIFVDLKPKDYLKILFEFTKVHSRPKLLKMLEDDFLGNPERERLLVNLSVRTGFDLFLQGANFPLGSEIIMTCINIPDMNTVLRHHGLICVPVEVDVDTLAPKIEDIERNINEKTKAIMLSYVFGVGYDIEPILKLAKKHNLFVVEDLAETFSSNKYNGHPEADVSLFSFGTIKYNTALNGAITVVRNNDVLYRKMKYIQDLYPMQLTSTYLKKCLKMSAMLLALNSTAGTWCIQSFARSTGYNAKEKAVAFIRGFPTDGEFLPKFRYQVCNTLLANMALRMHSFDNEYMSRRMAVLKKAQDKLMQAGIQVPGHPCENRSFWLFPIVVPDIPLCYNGLIARGVDAYLGATQLRVIQPPSGSKYEEIVTTQEYFDKILYLPLHKEVPDHIIDEIVKRTIEVIQEITRQLNQKPKL